ncbi:unnamed protein product [Adineta steineri]|uniref:NAD(P)(+)--arginine ADP-ribosyltransferase n=1 Tax=Adineta steineri TaxID=433720 RepID=A0A813P1L4_9BILA|nr:unnamed protein product [Adineta steineri]CAF4116945.1 unnamed protein product [Adineta steineri]
MMNRFGDIDTSFKRLPPVYGYHSEELVTIEKALQPIESQIRELTRYIKIARQYCHFPSEHGLTKDQSAAIYIYTMEWGETTLYRVLNIALRSENRQALKVWFPFLKLFDTALDKLPTVKEVLWRGVPLDIGKNFTKNQQITWWSINSCSSSANVIKNFLGNGKNSTLFLIEAINGKKISDYTEYESEDEIILRMGTQFRVKYDTLEQSNGSHIVHLVEIDDSHDESLSSAMTQMHVTPKPSNMNEMHVTPQSSAKTQMHVTSKPPTMNEMHVTPQSSAMTQMHVTPKPSTMNEMHVTPQSSAKTQMHVTSKPPTMNEMHVTPQSSAKTQMHVSPKPSNQGASEQLVLVNHININTKWKQHGITIAGGNGHGNQLNQLSCPWSIYVDDDHQTIYIADFWNSRIVEWKYGAKNGQIVAGGNGQGNRSDQLNGPTDVIVDKKNDSLIICDYGNRRVVRWLRQNGTNGETIISDIDCSRLTMDNNGDLYASDREKNEVRRWKLGETEGTIVAGGNEEGNDLNQLHCPTHIFVDEDHSVYVSDCDNHRVMKWVKGAKEGIVVAGGKGEGNSLTQLSSPQGVIVDHLGNVYVADWKNHRIMRWCKGSCEGSIIVGGNGEGKQANQLSYLRGLSFDVQGDLYVADYSNHRIQKFDIDLN